MIETQLNLYLPRPLYLEYLKVNQDKRVALISLDEVDGRTLIHGDVVVKDDPTRAIDCSALVLKLDRTPQTFMNVSELLVELGLDEVVVQKLQWLKFLNQVNAYRPKFKRVSWKSIYEEMSVDSEMILIFKQFLDCLYGIGDSILAGMVKVETNLLEEIPIAKNVFENLTGIKDIQLIQAEGSVEEKCSGNAGEISFYLVGPHIEFLKVETNSSIPYGGKFYEASIQYIQDCFSYLYFQKNSKSKFNSSTLIHLEHLFMDFPLPLAVVGHEGELFLHNNQFSQIGVMPNECLSLEDETQIEKNGLVYTIYRHRLKDHNLAGDIFLFYEDSLIGQEAIPVNVLKSISMEELGIITSSMAHELNNPISGILAGVEYLALESEDMDSEEIQSSLSQMKESASRCAQLVDVFLGFSRANPMSPKGAKAIDALHRAVEILRYRMVELGITLNVKNIKEEGQRATDHNQSIITMVFYLILNDAITKFSHQKLVFKKENLGAAIDIDFVENQQGIGLTFDTPIPFKVDEGESNKLLKDLASLANLNLVGSEGKLSISYL